MIHRCLICHNEDVKNYYIFYESDINPTIEKEKYWRIALPFCESCANKDSFVELSRRFARAEFDRLDFQSVVDRYCESLENQFK